MDRELDLSGQVEMHRRALVSHGEDKVPSQKALNKLGKSKNGGGPASRYWDQSRGMDERPDIAADNPLATKGPNLNWNHAWMDFTSIPGWNYE